MNDQVISAVFAPVAVFVVQFLKGKLGLQGLWALWLAFAVSVVFGLIATLVTGSWATVDLSDPVTATSTALRNATTVFTVATLIYRSFKEDKNGQENAEG